MNKSLKGLAEGLKSPRVLVIGGLCGILLIFLSSLFGSDTPQARGSEETVYETAEEYRSFLEESVSRIVYKLTGDSSAAVVITLESGIKYSYADELSEDNSSSRAENGEQSSESSEKSYVTVKTSDGGEQALLVAETLPRVRGVAIVCRGGDDAETAEKLEGAVMAALDITSKRVYIAGGADYEKR